MTLFLFIYFFSCSLQTPTLLFSIFPSFSLPCQETNADDLLAKGAPTTQPVSYPTNPHHHSMTRPPHIHPLPHAGKPGVVRLLSEPLALPPVPPGHEVKSQPILSKCLWIGGSLHYPGPVTWLSGNCVLFQTFCSIFMPLYQLLPPTPFILLTHFHLYLSILYYDSQTSKNRK
jgi:hypothetical protein